MKKIILIFLLLSSFAGYAQLQLPYSIKLVNPKPVDFYYYNTSGTPYTNTAQVISQVVSAIRYRGQTFNVAGVEYWFEAGIADGDLVVKGGGGGSFVPVNGSAITVNGTGDGFDLRGSIDPALGAGINLNGSGLSIDGSSIHFNLDAPTESASLEADILTFNANTQFSLETPSGTGTSIQVLHADGAGHGDWGDILNSDLVPALNNSRTFTSADDLDQSDNLRFVYTNCGAPCNITVDLLSTDSYVTVSNIGSTTATLIAGAGVTLPGGTVSIPAGGNAMIVYRLPATPDIYTGTSTSGTVTTVSVVSANGFAGSVATATTTPAITLSTTITGLLKGNGTAISAATSGTDYAPATSGSAVLKGNGSGGFSAALNSDLPAMTATVGGAVPTPPNNTTTFLRGDGTFAAPAGSGTVNPGTSGQLAYYATSSSAVSGTTTGTGVLTALGVNIGSAGAPVLFNGAGGTPSSITLTSATGLPISTGLTGGATNRVPYFTSATALSTSGAPIFDGTNFGIGATPQAILTASLQTSIQAPVTGSLAQFIGLDANPLRITFDTHNNASASGTAFMGRRSRGTAASPSALSSDDVIMSLNGRGYGTSQYAAASTGLIEIKAGQTFTNANNGTYIDFQTTPDGSVTAAERFRIGQSGQWGIGGPTYGTSGNVFKSGGSAAAPTWGTVAYSELTGTVPFWSLSTGGTLSGANTITGSTSNTLKAVFNSQANTNTDGAGLWLANTTAAATGVSTQQNSPMLTLEGQGWKTTATAASQSVKFGQFVLPIEGTTNPSAMYRIVGSVNGAAYSSTPFLGITTAGRFLFNTATVNGAYAYTFQSLGTSSSTYNTIWQNSTPSILMTLADNGVLSVANGNGAIFQVSGIANSTNIASPSLGTNAKGHVFHNAITQALSTGDAALYLTTSTQVHTSGTIGTVNVNGSYTISSGTGNTIQVQVRPTYTTSSTYVGSAWGVDFDPNLAGTTGLTIYGFTSRPVLSLSGFATGTPTSTLHTAGSFAGGYIAKTANYTATVSDYTIECTANTFQVTLPTAVGINGRIYNIVNSGAGTITVGTTSSQTFVNVTATPTTLTMATIGTTTVQSNGANWIKLSGL